MIGGDQSGRDGNVTRIPYCRDNHTLASYIASADAFVHAGMHETFGLVVLEAMACGRPVVAMRAGALPELVDPGAGNLAEPHEDPHIAAANLADAITDVFARDLDVLGAAARRHVLANYSWSRALQSLMARYQQAVSARRLPTLADGLAQRGNAHALDPARPLLQVVLGPLHAVEPGADAKLIDVIRERALQRFRAAEALFETAR